MKTVSDTKETKNAKPSKGIFDRVVDKIQNDKLSPEERQKQKDQDEQNLVMTALKQQGIEISESELRKAMQNQWH